MKLFSLIALSLLAFETAGCAMDDGTDDPGVEQSGSLTCPGAVPLEVIVKGRENRFGLDGQQVALNPTIPIERLCNNRVAASCKATCNEAKAKAAATGIRGFQDPDPARLHQMGILADDFNAALGLQTNFKALGTDANGNVVEQCNAKVLQVVVRGKEHRFGFDNREVALNPAIPMQNICQRVAGSCQAKCAAAQAAAVATGVRGFSGNDDAAQLRRMGVVADDFNAALGNKSNFKDGALILN